MLMKLSNSEQGQALIEFIIFLPLMLIMYVTLVSLGNAINGSINQQKITRGYFYARVLNNSTIPKPSDRDQSYKNWSQFGMFFIGYAERKEGNTPVAACYKLELPTPSGESSCDKYSGTSTTYVRVETAFGICGGTYIRNNNDISWSSAATNQDGVRIAASIDGCTIK
jgi:hypothetical protein